MGSVNIVAHLKKIYRRLDDIDILIDSEKKECVFTKLRENHFQVEKKHFLVFSWYEATKKNHLKLTFFLIGEFQKDHFFCRFGVFTLKIALSYLKPTEYNFRGILFVGVPMASVVDGIDKTSFNPKRIIDRTVLAIEKSSVNAAVKGKLHIYFLGYKTPFLYEIVSFACNVYGGIVENPNKYRLIK